MGGESRRFSVSWIRECLHHSHVCSCPWALDCVSQHASVGTCFQNWRGARGHASSIRHVPRSCWRIQTSRKRQRAMTRTLVWNRPFECWICKGGYGWGPHVWGRYMSQVWKESSVLCASTASISAAWPPCIHHTLHHGGAGDEVVEL